MINAVKVTRSLNASQKSVVLLLLVLVGWSQDQNLDSRVAATGSVVLVLDMRRQSAWHLRGTM